MLRLAELHHRQLRAAPVRRRACRRARRREVRGFSEAAEGRDSPPFRAQDHDRPDDHTRPAVDRQDDQIERHPQCQHFRQEPEIRGERLSVAREIASSAFTLVYNGAADSPPASGVRDFLLARRAPRVTTIVHPLQREDDPGRRVTVYEPDRAPVISALPGVPVRPPLTYALDPVLPPWPGRTDCWIGFNNLAAARGLVQRRLGRADTVVYWAVDFVPERFGKSVLTHVYDRLDSVVCRRADLRVDLSQAALEGRNERHGFRAGDAAPAVVAPIGAWLDRLPTTPEDGWRARRVIFLGHLVPRQGVGTLIEALALLADRGVAFEAEVAGRGPLEEDLRRTVAERNLDGRVRFAGFLSDHRDVERFVASASVARAPYDTAAEAFTRS